MSQDCTANEFRILRQRARRAETPVVFHSFAPGELKRAECFGVYAGPPRKRIWIDTLDTVEQVLAEYPNAVRQS